LTKKIVYLSVLGKITLDREKLIEEHDSWFKTWLEENCDVPDKRNGKPLEISDQAGSDEPDRS